MWSAVSFAPSVIVFVMFDIDGAAAPKGPMTYGTLRTFLRPLRAFLRCSRVILGLLRAQLRPLRSAEAILSKRLSQASESLS